MVGTGARLPMIRAKVPAVSISEATAPPWNWGLPAPRSRSECMAMVTTSFPASGSAWTQRRPRKRMKGEASNQDWISAAVMGVDIVSPVQGSGGRQGGLHQGNPVGAAQRHDGVVEIVAGVVHHAAAFLAGAVAQPRIGARAG